LLAFAWPFDLGGPDQCLGSVVKLPPFYRKSDGGC